MARTARGADVLERAREVLARAQTVEQLRQAQSVRFCVLEITDSGLL
jgi:hypothetical protein